MRRVDVLNLLALLLALGLSAWGATQSTGRGERQVGYYPHLQSNVKPVTLPDGTRALVDAGGVPTPLVRYERILSGSLIADRVLADLCEPTRIVGWTRFANEGSLWGHRFAGKPRLDARGSVETVLDLHPDLMIVNNVVDPGRVARLREQGVRVFDLGHMRGLASLLENIRAIGWLIGAPKRAEAYAVALDRRLDAVAPEPAERPGAMYMNVYADRLYGGADHTSYHDVLEHAGLSDAAAAAGFDGWPELTPEQVLAINPRYVVTRPGMGSVLCGRDALSALRACRQPHGVLEVDGMLLDDPGPTILDAAEALRAAFERARATEGP